jgi:hypothetical protein
MGSSLDNQPPYQPLNKGGRPPHRPSLQTCNVVRMCAGYGVPQGDIARALKITRPTLTRYYKREIKTGKARTQIQLVSNLLAMSNLKNATGVKATIFALTTRFGWSQHAGPPPEELLPSRGKK